MYEVDRETFVGLVTAAVADLSDKFRERVTNLDFVVEDLASSDDYARVGVSGGTLLGVYRGIPLTRRGRRSGAARTVAAPATRRATHQ